MSSSVGTYTNGAYPIPQGIEVSLNYDTTTKFGDWYKLSDHNRNPIGITYTLVEQADRMANGTLRKYVVARKFVITADWKDFPTLDSNVVDYNGGSVIFSSTPTLSQVTTTTTTAYIPPETIQSESFSNYFYIGSGNEVLISPSAVPQSGLPATGTTVTISGMNNTASGFLQNGNYQVISNVGGVISISAPGVTGQNIACQGTVSWNSGIPIYMFAPADKFDPGKGYTANDLFVATTIPYQVFPTEFSAGDTVTIYGSAIESFNGVFTIDSVMGNGFVIKGVTATVIYSPQAPNQYVYMVKGNYPNPGATISTVTTTVASSAPTQTTYSGPFGAAWIKSFYEANAFIPVWVRVMFAKDPNPTQGSIPDPTQYTDSQNTEGQIYQAYMTTFTYDISKRRTGPNGHGYDYVNLKIEFTEV